MHWSEAVLIALAGFGAGAINAAVGSGTLITFPALLALGFPPVLANVSNNIGLVPGGVAGVWGYRRELAGCRRVLTRLVPCSAIGGVAGAVLLLQLPADVFRAVVPVLIAVAVVLVLLQPRLATRVAAGRGTDVTGPERPGVLVAAGTFATGIYGGYFGAAQGVLLIGLLGWLLTDSLQIANALKNVLASVVNAVAAVTFLIVAPEQVDWLVAGSIATGAILGGLLGADLGRRLPASALRGLIVVVGSVAIVRQLLT